MQEVFASPVAVAMEIVEIQSDIELKARTRDQDLWSLVSADCVERSEAKGLF